MKFTVCPFCGVVSESAHDSQEACIHALQSEIDRMRRALAPFAPAQAPGSTAPPANPREDEN